MRSTKRAKIFSEGGVGGVPSPQPPSQKKVLLLCGYSTGVNE
jgi:hypothetical protein